MILSAFRDMVIFDVFVCFFFCFVFCATINIVGRYGRSRRGGSNVGCEDRGQRCVHGGGRQRGAVRSALARGSREVNTCRGVAYH